jgi:hypothetical protein
MKLSNGNATRKEKSSFLVEEGECVEREGRQARRERFRA